MIWKSKHPFPGERIPHILTFVFLLLLFTASAYGSTAQKAFELLHQKRFEEAIIACENALSVHPRDAVVHFNLGLAFYHSLRFASAQRSFETAIELSLEDPDFQALAKYNAGNACFEQARLLEKLDRNRSLDLLKLAIHSWGDAVELDPELTEAHDNLILARKVLQIMEGGELKPEEEGTASAGDESEATDTSSDEENGDTTDSTGSGSDSGSPTPSSETDAHEAATDRQESTDLMEGVPHHAPTPEAMTTEEALQLLDRFERLEKHIVLSTLDEAAEEGKDPLPNW